MLLYAFPCFSANGAVIILQQRLDAQGRSRTIYEISKDHDQYTLHALVSTLCLNSSSLHNYSSGIDNSEWGKNLNPD